MVTKRLLWRLFPAYLIITLLALAGVTWYATRSLRVFSRDETRTGLSSRARLLEGRAAELVASGDSAAVDGFCKKLGRRSGTRITVMLPSGEVVGDSEEDPARMENHATADRPEMTAALGGKEGVSTRFSETLKKDMMYLALPLRRDDRLIGVVRTSLPVRTIEEALRSVHSHLAIAGLVVAGFAAAVSWLVSRRVAEPLEEMKRTAERFADGDLETRLPVPDTEELAALAEAMNHMAAQLGERLRTILEQRNEHEAILASMVEGVLAVDTEERLMRMNQGAARMLGVDADRQQGRSIQEVVRNPALQKLVASALAASGPVESEIVLSNGDERILQAHGATLRDAQGSRIGAVVVLNDVTHLRRLEAVRRDFVANVSHELRTPITSIKGFVETLLDGALSDPDEAPRFLAIIAAQVDRLNAIIEDLLLLSRLEREGGTREMELEAGAIRPVLERAIAVCAIKAEDKQIAIELTCDGDLQAPVSAPLLEQAVVNLIDNAINYSEPQSRVEVEAAADDSGVAIAVHDQGCGIQAEHLPRLFERFYRVDKARSRTLGGTGLGLAIVKHIAQAHGGRVAVESTPGKGSVFSLHLPTP